MKILLADDSAIVRKSVGRAITEAGHECTLAEDGNQALQLALTQPFDLLITDLTMPVVDGFNLISRLRNTGKTANLPILVLTVNRDPQAVAQLARLGISGYLLKPASEETLIGAINKATA